MPHCVHCNELLKCTCAKPVQPIGQTVIDCPKSIPGKLWIHVMDDTGRTVKDVDVAGPPGMPTDECGLARFENLKTGGCDAKLIFPPSKEMSKVYLAPADVTQREKRVTISEGTLAYVLFTLTRKSTLKVRFEYVADPQK